MSTPVDVVCVGEAMALVAPDPPAPLREARTMTLAHGGAESNAAVSLARLGDHVQWCSRLGEDALGRRVRAEIQAAGVDVSLVELDPHHRTGVYFKDPGHGSTQVLYYRDNSAASHIDERDFARAIDAGPRALHISGVTPALSESCRRGTRHGVEAAGQAGVTVSFDVNYRAALWPDAVTAGRELEAIARRCDIVFVGADEAALLWGTGSPSQVADHLSGAGTIVVKDGAGPARSFEAETVTCVTALPVEVAEPVGAGDAFAAGWLHGHLMGLDAAAKLRLGHLVAAESLTSATDHGSDWPAPDALEAEARRGTRWEAAIAVRSGRRTA